MRCPTTRRRAEARLRWRFARHCCAKSRIPEASCESSVRMPLDSRYCTKPWNRIAWFVLECWLGPPPDLKPPLPKEARNETHRHSSLFRSRVRWNRLGCIPRRRARCASAFQVCARGASALSGGERFFFVAQRLECFAAETKLDQE